MLAQHQGAGALGEFKLFQGAHAEQNLFAAKAGGDDGAHVAQHDVAQAEAVQHGAIAGGLAVGGVQHHRRTAGQSQPLGQLGRHGDVRGAGVEQKGDRFAIDLAAGDEMPLDVASQLHLDLLAMQLGYRLAVRVEAILLPGSEEARRQVQPDAPGEHQHHPPGTTPGRLAHGRAIQPPLGAAKRQTMGRFSPSPRALPLLSTPIQAPSASIHSASALPNGSR